MSQVTSSHRLEAETAKYWLSRRDTSYLERVRRLTNVFARTATSMVDVGSRDCPYLEWYPEIKRRVSLDLEYPYFSEGVEGIKIDFFDWKPTHRFDICLCLQVLEHVPSAHEFAQKLLVTAKHLVVSVPYMWPEDLCEYHVHDPVDEQKLVSWFGREPDLSIVATEKPGKRIPQGVQRIICYYDCG